MCGDPEHEDETVTGADMVGDQLRGLVDPSGTPLHGCVGYQEEALLAVATGAAEALSDVHSRVFEGSDLEGSDLAKSFRTGLKPIWQSGIIRSHKILKGRQFEPFSPRA